MLVETVAPYSVFVIGPVLAPTFEFVQKKSVKSTNIYASLRLENKPLIRMNYR